MKNQCDNEIHAKSSSVPSLIKWTGSKRSQANHIADLIPKFERYIEPFLGGGSMLYKAAKPGSIASDIYAPLINLWKIVQKSPNDLINNYKEQWEAVNEELNSYDVANLPKNEKIPKYFYSVRDRFNENKDPMDLNFIMRTCVNGIVRFNDKGEFNNSFHLSRRGMEPARFEKVVNLWHPRINGISFFCEDFETTLSMAKKGDFVYLDPPYAGNMQRYIGDIDLERLFSALDSLNIKGVKWALSFDGHRGEKNLVHAVPDSLYKQHVFIFSGQSAVKRVLGGQQEDVRESLYLNYYK
jgi:DNA adenine methylase